MTTETITQDDIYVATEAEFQTGPLWANIVDNPAFDAMSQWCRDHDIDPDVVLAIYPIKRTDRTVTFTRAARDPEIDSVPFRVTVERDSVAPWPAEVVADGTRARMAATRVRASVPRVIDWDAAERDAD